MFRFALGVVGVVGLLAPGAFAQPADVEAHGATQTQSDTSAPVKSERAPDDEMSSPATLPPPAAVPMSDAAPPASDAPVEAPPEREAPPEHSAVPPAEPGAPTTKEAPHTADAPGVALPPPDAPVESDRSADAYAAGQKAGQDAMGPSMLAPYFGAAFCTTCCGAMCGGLFAGLPYLGVVLGPLFAGVAAWIGTAIAAIASGFWSPTAPDKAREATPETFGEGYQDALDEDTVYWRIAAAIGGGVAAHALSIVLVWTFTAAWFVAGAAILALLVAQLPSISVSGPPEALRALGE